MDKLTKWNEWSEHVVDAIAENNRLNKSQKSLTTFLIILVGILISLIGYIWVDEKSDNKERYELMTKTLNTLIENDRDQDVKITEINQWREDWEKAKKEHNARSGTLLPTPNQLINKIQFVPDESQVAGR
jgi:hypothetical protein